jgi:hypothetical protein
MPLPDLAGFEALLSSLSVVPPADLGHYGSEIVTEEGVAIDVGRRVAQSEQRLWFLLGGEIGFEALLRRVQDELRHSGHVTGRPTVLALLHNFALLQRLPGACISLLNGLFAAIIDCDITQMFVLPLPPPPDFHFRVGRFAVGPLHSERLAYRCRKARSDYFERYGALLNGGLAIERDVFRARVVDWNTYIPAMRPIAARLMPSGRAELPLLENYFQSVTTELYDDFWEGLREDQLLTLAVGASLFDGDKLRLLPNSNRITIILNAGPARWGYVAPHSSATRIDLAGTNKRIPQALRTLAEFGIGGPSQSELYASLSSFARFVGRARRHTWDGRHEEGFLHFIIALDLLLGEKESSTDAVAGRSAVLVHRAMGRGFDEQFKIMTRLYDKRSRYVHQGQAVDPTDVVVADSICTEVLYCLLRMHGQGRAEETGLVTRWQKELDYLRSAIEAGRNLSDDEFSHNGILVQPVSE